MKPEECRNTIYRVQVKELLKERGIVPSKKFGQSFLVSEKIATRIVSACKIQPEDILFEIGAGLGILTEHLCAYGARVFAVEKERLLFDFLTRRFNNTTNLTLLNQDVLSLKLSTLEKWAGTSPAPTDSLCSDKSEPYNQFKLVSNLPYSISSDFLYWVLDNRSHIGSCILTLQREVAQRIYALPGTKAYGSISVLLQSYMQIKPLFLIHGESFYPKSKVISQVMALKPKTQVPTVNEQLFFKIVHTAFAMRRKQLKNSLRLKATTIGEIDLTRRPETLKYEEFINLTLALQCMELN